MNLLFIFSFMIVLSAWMGILILIIAKIALILSFIAIKRANRIAKTDFILSHRPYVWAEDVESKNALNEVSIKVHNSPAHILREYYSYYIIDKQGNKNIIEEQEHNDIIRYPDKKQYINTLPLVTNENAYNMTVEQNLERVVEIEYSWLSNDKRYSFNSKSYWHIADNQWYSISQDAN